MIFLACQSFNRSRMSFSYLVCAVLVRGLDNRAALSTGKIAIQWISVNKTNHAINLIAIHPVDSVIHLLNNLGHVDK